MRFSTWQSSESYSSYGGQWGGYFDQETGLVLLGSRYYDPTTGRFLTRDPIGYEGGINLYAYCGNNPVNAIDPFGLLTVGGFDFTWDGTVEGIKTGLAATANVFSGGLYSGGRFRNQPGFDTSVQLAQVADTALTVADGVGIASKIGKGFKAARAARATVAEEFNMAAHGLQPRPRGVFQSHHIIQDEWAEANIVGYDTNEAPSILLRRGNASHSIITTAQNARRDARLAAGQGRWSSSLRQEFEYASNDLRAAGVPDAIRKRALKKAYKHFYGKLGAR